MASIYSANSASSQWIFPISALDHTPTALERSSEEEMYDRARGIEFLFRLGTSIGLHSPGIFTAATWFHRFFMRYSMEDYHRQNVAASCIFLTTKTEECGRKLRDVARVFVSKVSATDIKEISENGNEVEEAANAILSTEEALLEALCFDFVVDSPHAYLVDLFNAQESNYTLEDYAWSIAHDSFRTPLCVLYPPRITAVACYVLAQRIADGPHSHSLDARISPSAPSASLPTPPSQKPASPDGTRFAIEFFGLNEPELYSVAGNIVVKCLWQRKFGTLNSILKDALSIIIEFYHFQASQGLSDYLGDILSVPPPTTSPPRRPLYKTFPDPNGTSSIPHAGNDLRSDADTGHGRTPDSVHGNSTPTKTHVNGSVSNSTSKRLDLS
ncbi:hypothetical protein EW146_g2780 [Bondarzewia mesenterica]|uniref:Cyclin-like domain-containing protein n=1 Tax=Bondarzewia mesenterica TaxID=1095465 RepID=A0A4S4M1H5_9AGAM|nr:hypothetical protein EW146_g2780 [Bondarzewia mesenterica]